MTNKKELTNKTRYVASAFGGCLPSIITIYGLDFELIGTFSIAYIVGGAVRLIINVILGIDSSRFFSIFW